MIDDKALVWLQSLPLSHQVVDIGETSIALIEDARDFEKATGSRMGLRKKGMVIAAEETLIDDLAAVEGMEVAYICLIAEPNSATPASLSSPAIRHLDDIEVEYADEHAMNLSIYSTLPERRVPPKMQIANEESLSEDLGRRSEWFQNRHGHYKDR